MYGVREDLNRYNEYPLTKQRKEIEFLTDRVTSLELELTISKERYEILCGTIRKSIISAIVSGLNANQDKN